MEKNMGKESIDLAIMILNMKEDMSTVRNKAKAKSVL